MLLSEMVRRLASEESLIDDDTDYSLYASTTFQTIHDYGSITLSEDSLLAIRMGVRIDRSGVIRLEIGGDSVITVSRNNLDSAYSGAKATLIVLPAGTYTVIVKGKSTSSYYVKVTSLKIGRLNFSDSEVSNYAAYSQSITKQVEERKTCVGAIQYATLFVHVWACTSGEQTSFANSAPSGNDVAIKVDGDYQTWDEKENDDESNSNYYGYGGYAIIAKTLTAGEDHTIEIEKANADTTVYISVVFCPWILPYTEDYQPLTLDFPQGSTLYLTLEPLFSDPTKNVKVGKKRAVSFGDSTDYYYTASGTGILAANYTFETVEVEGCILQVSGFGGCISIIGVDVR